MKAYWRKTALTIVLSSALVTTAVPVWAAEGSDVSAVTESAAGTYSALTDALQVQVKSLLNERTSSGVRIAAVVEYQNTSSEIKRIPEYEIRVQSDAGTEFTLKPSLGSAVNVQPQSKTEVSYMVQLDRQDELKLTELSWVDVDYYTYPKTETPILSLPVEGLAWEGDNAKIKDEAAIKKWGEPFQITSAHSPVIFTPVSWEKASVNGKPTVIVKLLAENNTAYEETIPSFLLQARSDNDLFHADRSEQGTITLQPGEKQYIHYGIVTDQDTVVTSLDVLTPETYAEKDALGQTKMTSYTVGRYNILLPLSGQDTRYVLPYTYNTPIVFDPLSTFVNPNVKVSLVEFNLHDSQGVGYKTAVAKFVLKNESAEPIATPAFQAELTTPDGYSYSGSRQANTPAQLMPNLSHVVTYSFILPESETGIDLKMNLLDTITAAPLKSSIASIKVVAQDPSTSILDTLSFYPFNVKVNSWFIQNYTVVTAGTGLTYGYKLKMDLDVNQLEGVVADQDFSKLEVDLLDSRHRTIAQEQLSFTSDNNGLGKLTSGQVILDFKNLRTDQIENGITMNIYETIQTQTGTAKRLVAELK